jgi:tetratricopeptide (TPR) repeat protein
LSLDRTVASVVGSLEPDEFDRWPAQGTALRLDVLAAVERFASDAEGGPSVAAYAARRARAVLFSAIRLHSEALFEADRLVDSAPLDSGALRTRALVKRRAGQLKAALMDIDRGLAISADDPALNEWHGRILTEMALPAKGLADVDRAILAGAGESAHEARARALCALGRTDEAVQEWARVLSRDPEDVDSRLGRACCFISMGNWDQALANLESAASHAGERPALLVRVAATYAHCLTRYPNRLPRVVAIARQAARSWWKSQAS